MAIGPRWATPLGAQGIRVGVAATVENVAPFGGPRVVRLGAARIAVARRVAATITVRS